MKLLYAPPSPYSAKVRMAAHHLGIECEAVRVQTHEDPALLIDNNPLGKIPTLLADDGSVLFDSRVIMQHFDRISGRRLFPRNTAKRDEAERLEALCDGILDCLLLIVYERRYRPEDLVHQPWIDRQWQKAERGLNVLDASLPRTTKTLNGGHFALAALTGYLDLRFPGQWTRGRARLKKWPAKFERFFPDYPALRPQP